MITATIMTAALFTQLPQLRFEPVHENTKFNEPVQVVFDGAHADVMYVVEKDGRVIQVSLDRWANEQKVFMDITDRVSVRNAEEGLLSLAFHPNHKDNGQLVVWYTARNPRRTILSRFTLDKETQTIRPDSEEELFSVKQPWGNHNGGTVLFDDQGFLYVSIGDGGSGNDPYGNGQNKSTLLATIVRIDIDTPSGDLKYSIPPDNPFVNEKQARGEIWAYGLRNVWRMSFDRKTGELWAGDVGQNKWEEIDIITRGGNFGWNAREGKHPFLKATLVANCIEPVHEYGRSFGGSITGGHVYRGSNIPEIVGMYIFADYMSEKVWLLSKQHETETRLAIQIAKETPIAISSFGETPTGEILACGFASPYTKKGKIYRLVSSSSKPTMR